MWPGCAQLVAGTGSDCTFCIIVLNVLLTYLLVEVGHHDSPL